MTPEQVSAIEERWEQMLNDWPRERIKPATVALCVDRALDALTAERQRAEAAEQERDAEWQRAEDAESAAVTAGRELDAALAALRSARDLYERWLRNEEGVAVGHIGAVLASAGDGVQEARP